MDSDLIDDFDELNRDEREFEEQEIYNVLTQNNKLLNGLSNLVSNTSVSSGDLLLNSSANNNPLLNEKMKMGKRILNEDVNLKLQLIKLVNRKTECIDKMNIVFQNIVKYVDENQKLLSDLKSYNDISNREEIRSVIRQIDLVLEKYKSAVERVL